MRKSILNVISSTLINLFSSQIYDGKMTLYEKFRLWNFCRILKKWTRQYIINHDGSVLTTGDFESFIKYHNLLENIFGQVMNNNTTAKDEFVRKQVALFHTIQKYPGNNQYDTDTILIGFIEHFYDEINSFFENNLSQNEKYLFNRVKEGNRKVVDTVRATHETTMNEFDEIKELLQSKGELTDCDLVWSIYQNLSNSILEGKISEVLQIYPLINGKSADLENSISYLLNMLSDSKTISRDFETIQKEIADNRIYNHVCRVAIYVNKWKKNNEFFNKVSDRNNDLWLIVQDLINMRHEKLYTIDKSEQDGITCFTYHLENIFPNETWLVKRICMLDMLQQQVFNGTDSVSQLINNSNNIIDQIILLERKINEQSNKMNIDKSTTKALYDEACTLVHLSCNFSIDLKRIVYEMLLRSSLLISTEKANEAAGLVPEILKGIKCIDFLLLQVKLNMGNVQIDEIINTCMKHNEYWLFNNYIVDNIKKDPSDMKALIEKYSFIIDLDASVYLIYLQLVNNLDGQEKAIKLSLDYEAKYGNLLEYWIDRLRINYTDVEMDNTIVKYLDGKLDHISIEGPLVFTKLLLQHKKYDDAIEIIKRHEICGNITNELLQLKAYALCKTGHEIDALVIYTKLFEEGNHSEEIIYYILALSCTNCRYVSKEVLSFAEQSENPKILMVTANIYVMDNNIEKAHAINMKALLRTTDCHSKVFNQFLGIENRGDHSTEINVTGIDNDTVVRLRNTKGNEDIIYAIHSVHHLPEEPYEWENATHIYKETAISLGMFRKKVGDSIQLNTQLYKINEIIPLNTYFFRLCIDKVIANGEARPFKIPATERNSFNIKKFTEIIKETVGDDNQQFSWLDQYKDLTQIPETFYISKRFVRATFFQLVSAMLTDKSILYRESLEFSTQTSAEYIFSYAALVILFKIGWIFSNNDSKYSIPNTLMKIIFEESEVVIQDNNREHVSFIGVNNNQLYFHETSEMDKAQYMQEAVALQSFTKKFNILDNQNDLHLKNDHHIDLKNIIGIADYDATVIAKTTKKTLVTGEIIISGLCHIPEICISTIGIADFLAKETNNVNDLLNYTQKMIEYKCTVPFTLNTIHRIIEFYNYTESDEEKESIITKWSNILQMPMEDEDYKAVMLSHMQECIIHLKDKEDKFTPIGECLLYSFLNYLGKKIQVSITEDGKVVTRIV